MNFTNRRFQLADRFALNAGHSDGVHYLNIQCADDLTIEEFGQLNVLLQAWQQTLQQNPLTPGGDDPSVIQSEADEAAITPGPTNDERIVANV